MLLLSRMYRGFQVFKASPPPPPPAGKRIHAEVPSRASKHMPHFLFVGFRNTRTREQGPFFSFFHGSQKGTLFIPR